MSVALYLATFITCREGVEILVPQREIESPERVGMRTSVFVCVCVTGPFILVRYGVSSSNFTQRFACAGGKRSRGVTLVKTLMVRGPEKLLGNVALRCPATSASFLDVTT